MDPGKEHFRHVLFFKYKNPVYKGALHFSNRTHGTRNVRGITMSCAKCRNMDNSYSLMFSKRTGASKNGSVLDLSLTIVINVFRSSAYDLRSSCLLVLKEDHLMIRLRNLGKAGLFRKKTIRMLEEVKLSIALCDSENGIKVSFEKRGRMDGIAVRKANSSKRSMKISAGTGDEALPIGAPRVCEKKQL
ncbi:hypothetical protein M514_02423 [Trichuris suis]|uniref:Uncharacterized protein n=1 Tax=Trichuris suis TaxID=68888 RepID=A0A085N5Q5_9BILA|nr:hypothetical protein M513_02423 [Trichuris suis]KFD64801.1 hypothetical protein M514_02423 [Trichuris suis]